jgi:drug/metabolite transporter (DMT)-like permease
VKQQERLGILFAALCVLSGAFVPAVAKLTTDRADPLLVAAATSVFAGLSALVVLAGRGELRALLDPRTAPRLLLIGFLGTCLANLLFFEGARRSSAIEAVLCLQAEPAYSLVAARVVLGHPMTARRIGAVLLLMLGIGLALGARGLSSSGGVALLLATPLCWQASHLVVLRGLHGVAPPVLTGARYVFGGALLALLWAAAGGHRAAPGRDELLALLPILAVQGVVLAYLGTMLWYATIARLDLARSTAIVVPSIPLLSIGASFLLLGEVATARQWAGLLLTASGVLVFVTAPTATRSV